MSFNRYSLSTKEYYDQELAILTEYLKNVKPEFKSEVMAKFLKRVQQYDAEKKQYDSLTDEQKMQFEIDEFQQCLQHEINESRNIRYLLTHGKLTDDSDDINYDPDITEYYLSVPNNYTKFKDLDTNEIDSNLTDTMQFYTKTDDENASYIVSGPETLTVGMNQINILVTAANGETKTYILNVYRMQNENVFLSNLRVSKGSTIYEMVPTFNQIKTGDYRVTVPNDVSEVLITATPEVNTTTVTGAGTKTLNTGDNKFKIKTTAENANITEEYTLIITREKNANAFLSELHVKDGEDELTLDPTFNKETYEIIVNVL